jgi:hypothetical protein
VRRGASAACEFDLEQAIQPLLQYAMHSGIVDKVGADGAFAVIKQAFAGTAEL